MLQPRAPQGGSFFNIPRSIRLLQDSLNLFACHLALTGLGSFVTSTFPFFSAARSER